jgi:hypothetical protein
LAEFTNVKAAIAAGKIEKNAIKKTKMSPEQNIDDVQEPIINAPPEVRQIIERVWHLEKNRLDRKSNSPINDDILDIVKGAVQ